MNDDFVQVIGMTKEFFGWRKLRIFSWATSSLLRWSTAHKSPAVKISKRRETVKMLSRNGKLVVAGNNKIVRGKVKLSIKVG
jgi:hypothetical protein